ncbi:MAG: VCBS repeat-containing protein [Planctomycetaceae bacterium]
MRSSVAALLFYAFGLGSVGATAADSHLERIQFNNPGLVVDLGVGLWAWPLPMDYDQDGDWDLVVSCPDKPYNGTYFFENPGPLSRAPQGSTSVDKPSTINHQPVFKPAVRIADGPTSVQVSFVAGKPVVMTPAKLYADFREHQYAHPIELPLPAQIDSQYKRYRANEWRLIDFEGDGDLDVIIGIEIWDDYGWDDAWDEKGSWKNGPLHGYVYLAENIAIAPPTSRDRKGANSAELSPLATDQSWPEFLGPRPVFAPAVKLTTTDDKPIDVFGMPSPSFADFDGDGDLDLICGEFLDGFTWFENVGTRSNPEFAPGEVLGSTLLPGPEGQERAVGGIAMDLQMITPTAVDWDNDGDVDLICGDEDGRVAFIERLSDIERLPDRELLFRSTLLSPAFAAPVYFGQEAADVKFGALVTPCSVDWDCDGDEDLICGNTAGYLGLIENLDAGNPPKWGAPRRLEEIRMSSDGQGVVQHVIRYAAGDKGSIQGPCEAKWGYTAPAVGRWDEAGGRPDIIVNTIWGMVMRHASSANKDVMLIAAPIGLDIATESASPAWTWWKPQPGFLATQWRTTPCVIDWNDDGQSDLVMLDYEGYLAFFERNLDPDPSGKRALHLGKRVFKIEGPCEFDGKHQPVGDKHDDLLRLNAGWAGKSGRRKLHIVDWDGDGRRDLLVNSTNVNWLRNVRTDDEGFVWFKDEGPLDTRVLAGHDTSPTTVDWDKNGIPDLLVGAEDGRLYYKQNPRTARIDAKAQ